MDFLIPKYQRNPNAMVHSIYQGVAPNGRTATTVVKASADRNRLEATTIYGPGLARGQSGRVAVLVLGGMVTSLDEMQYILEAKRDKKFVPQRSGGEISQMCHILQQRRNEQIEARRKYLKANPSEAPKPRKRTITLHLPVGFRYMLTSEPGLSVLART